MRRYIVTCVIMQKNGAGMNTAATMYWDTAKDGKCVLNWSNKTMHVLVCRITFTSLKIDYRFPLQAWTQSHLFA